MTTNAQATPRVSGAPKYSFKRTYQISEALQRQAAIQPAANGNNSKSFNAPPKRQQNESINTSSGSSSGYLSALTPNKVGENNNNNKHNIYNSSNSSKPHRFRSLLADTQMAEAMMRAPALSGQHEYHQQPATNQHHQHHKSSYSAKVGMRTPVMVPMMIDDDDDVDEDDDEDDDEEDERFNNVDQLIDDDMREVDYNYNYGNNNNNNNNNHTTLSAFHALQLNYNHPQQHYLSSNRDCADAKSEQQRAAAAATSARLDLQQLQYLQVNEAHPTNSLQNHHHHHHNQRTNYRNTGTYQKCTFPLNKGSASSGESSNSATSHQNNNKNSLPVHQKPKLSQHLQHIYHPQLTVPPINSFSYIHYPQPSQHQPKQQQQILAFSNYHNQYTNNGNPYLQNANIQQNKTKGTDSADEALTSGQEKEGKRKGLSKKKKKNKLTAKKNNKMQGSRQQLTPATTGDSMYHHHHHHHRPHPQSSSSSSSKRLKASSSGRNTPAASVPKSHSNKSIVSSSSSATKEKPPLSCCGKMTRLLLFVTNIAFWTAGIALGAWGILQLVDDHKYNLSQLLVFEPNSKMSLFQLLSWSFITLGCATILVGFCGCSAILKNNRWILGLYIFLILAIFALDLATGLLAIIFQEKLVANVRLRLGNKLRTEYGVQASFTAAIDYIQTKYECCGLEGHFDYDQSLWRLQRLGGFEATVARTCCHLRNTFDDQAHINPRPVNESMCQSTDVRFHQSYRYRKGCLDDLERLVRQKIWFFTIGCGAVGGVILLSLLFATCFCRSIPNGSSKKNTSKSNRELNYTNERSQLSSGSLIEAQDNKFYNKKLKGHGDEDEFS